jgi:hypothetical protein
MMVFLRRFRRRLRWVWAWSTAAWLAPVVAAVAAAVVGVGWLAPWGWPEPAAAGLVGAVAVLIASWALVQPLPLGVVARAADRGLDSHDSFAAALQFSDGDGPFGARIGARAEALATGARPAAAAPLPDHGRRWMAAVGIGVAALALALAPNPQDDARADRAAVEERLDQAADRVEEIAEELEAQTGDTGAVDRVEQLADELRAAEDLETADELLREAGAELVASRPEGFDSRQAAAQGLERSLAQRPLGDDGNGSSPAAEQLEALADDLDQLTEAELAELAERLEELAALQEAGNPELADHLGTAASNLAANDLAGARAALGDAALAQQAAGASVTDRRAVDTAAGRLADARTTLADGSDRSSTGDGEGSGSGSGEGEGSGQGSGSGEGEGSGQGSGSGEGSGASGQVGGADGGSGAGRGGAGAPGGVDQDRVDTNDDATIVDPDALAAAEGEETPLGGDPSRGAEEVVGRADGPTTAGSSQVPLSDVIADYADRATAATDGQRLRPGERQVVGDYFDLLSR